LILTAREPEHIRREVLQYGVSQIDAGTKLEIGAYTEMDQLIQNPEKEQFLINDNRSLREVIDELLSEGYILHFALPVTGKAEPASISWSSQCLVSSKDIVPQCPADFGRVS